MYRIFSSVPIVWVSESTAQIGSDDPIYLEGLARGDGELVNALRLGIPAHDLDGRAQRCGITPDRAVRLLTLLDEAGALDAAVRDVESGDDHDAFAHAAGLDPRRVAHAIAAARIAVVGPLATRLVPVLTGLGLSARSADPNAEPPTGHVVVLTAVLAPDLLGAGQMFDADLRHLHLTVGESAASIGHLIVPRSTPCSGCLAAHASRTDDTWLEAWRSLRGIAWGPERLDPGLVALACAHCAVRLRDAITGRGDECELKIRLPDCALERAPVTFARECACRIPLSRALAG